MSQEHTFTEIEFDEKFYTVEYIHGMKKISSKEFRRIEDSDYYVSHDGYVLSMKKQEPVILTPWNARGYEYIQICEHGKRKAVLVHRLVAEAYIPNPHNKAEVNHKDKDRKHNHVDNLEWVTRKENMCHCHGHEEYIKE